MLEIRPVYTSYEREEYTKMFGIEPQDGFDVIAAINGGKFVGSAYVSFENETGYIHHISLIDGYDDFVDRFLLGKATLNFLDLKGVKNVIFKAEDKKLAKDLGFIENEKSDTVLNLKGYFTGEAHCTGCK